MLKARMLIFTYVFLGVLITVGCALNVLVLKKISEAAPQAETLVDCGALHDKFSLRTPYICAPWEDGWEFNRLQRERRKLDVLYYEHCRDV